MKDFPAIATIEFGDIPTGIYATDAMIKRAPIAILKCGTISRGRYLTLIGGTTASVEESYAEGCARAGDARIDSLLLPDIHPALMEGVLGKRTAPGDGALAVLEADTVSALLRGTEVALKGTPVSLVETRLADSLLAGKGISILHGVLHDVEAAVALAVDDAVLRNAALNRRVITAPHEALAAVIGAGTRFGPVPTQRLEDGEVEA